MKAYVTLFWATLTWWLYFVENKAKEAGGAIFAGMECVVSLNHSRFKNNRAKFGGCFYGVSLPLEVQDCACQENLASTNGGCFYLESSNATFEASNILSNHADDNGGGIYVSDQTLLRIWNTFLVSNSANHGGGVALLNGSRLLCVFGQFENNSANQGGGLYIISNASQFLLGQLTMSIFRGNNASTYGGVDLILL